MNTIAIDVQNITKTYKLYDRPSDRLREALHPLKKKYHHDFHALDTINFQIRKGETVGIIGKNGAGKSTLLKIITGVLTPSSGAVVVQGKIASLLELGAGFNPEYTGLENIFFQGSLMGFNHHEMTTKIEAILAFADIGAFIHQPVKMYSSGMFARLAFSVAINVAPDVLIVDEALAVGDAAFQLRCMDKMHNMMQQGVTILFVSHELNAIKRFCKTAIWINAGIVQLIGDVDNVTDRYNDFLKLSEPAATNAATNATASTNIYTVATILSLTTKNSALEPLTHIDKEAPLFIDIEYEVTDDTIKNPVLGIALYSIDNVYICGLNTLLENKRIPWKKGLNTYRLVYTQGPRVLGGTYYFDCALFEQTATVPFDHRTRFKQLIVTGTYEAEGIFTIPHKWQETTDE